MEALLSSDQRLDEDTVPLVAPEAPLPHTLVSAFSPPPPPPPPSHWDETRGARSIWPEVFFALSCPWHLAGRVYKTLGGPSATPFTAVLALLWLIASIGSSSDVGDEPVWFTLFIFIVALFTVLAAFLRSMARTKLHVDGSFACDCCRSVPWCACVPCAPIGYPWELALMHRHLADALVGSGRSVGGGEGGALQGGHASEPPPTRPPARSPPAHDAFSTPLVFGCSCALDESSSLAEYQCATCCPWFAQLRIGLRLGVIPHRSWVYAAALLFLHLLPALLLFISLLIVVLQDPSSWEEDDPRGGVAVITGSILYATELLSLPVTLLLRRKLRASYGIRGTSCGDLGAACCCWACALAQMERETTIRLGGPTAV